MTREEKKEKIKELVLDMLKESYESEIKQIDKVLNSSAIDIDSWDDKKIPMILPKTILTAILKNESIQYEGKGTSYEKMIKKEVNNILHFL